MENKTPVFIGIAAVAIIGIAIFAFSSSNQETASNQTNPSVVETQQGSGTAQGGAAGTAQGQGPAESGIVGDEMAEFEDGTYTATGSYISPAGEETIDVSITLEGGVITASEFTGNATNEKSVTYQGLFASGYEDQIIGKMVNEVALDKVSGSSLTPKGFNDALDQIRTQAQG